MELLGFKVHNYGLKHESMIKVFDQSAGSVPCFSRPGFCHKNLRDVSLSCAHSISWFSFLEELKKYPMFFQRESVQASLQRLDGLRVRVFKLDHQKGDLEKKRIENPYCEETACALKELHETHSSIIKKMEGELQFLIEQKNIV